MTRVDEPAARAARVLHGAAAAGLAVWIAAGAATLAAMSGQPVPPPRLVKQGTATQLVVDGAPFLVLGGEVGNSSGEPGYLQGFWPALEALNLNTLLVPVYWDRLEPAEGQFDFGPVDGVVRDARAHGMRLVLLWFGSWKNSMSCYAPAWVKLDTARFPRAKDSAGRSLEILSPFAAANRDADARAFRALMRHVREIDADHRTVVMVQVENEIGMIPEARDRSAAADAAFAGQVPAGLLDYLRRHDEQLAPELRSLWAARGRPAAGSWAGVFGDGPAASEVFTAWHFAAYTQSVTAAGKAEYDLPMFVNAALIRPGYLPGQYPSGGPLPHLFDVWRAAAPAVDFLSPDIYFPNFAEWCRRYARSGNPLFIPEAQRSAEATVNVMYAVAQHDAIGFAPFGIESISGPASGLSGEELRTAGRAGTGDSGGPGTGRHGRTAAGTDRAASAPAGHSRRIRAAGHLRTPGAAEYCRRRGCRGTRLRPAGRNAAGGRARDRHRRRRVPLRGHRHHGDVRAGRSRR